MKAADQYMKQKQISINMQMKVRKYLEYVQESRSKNMVNEGNLMNELSTSLKRELTIGIWIPSISYPLIFKKLMDE